MIVLIPVSRFKVPYETARGRPYSGLEKAVLSDVADGGATLTSLKSAFRVHERLLVEATVTLISAGWVAVVGGGADAQFVLTAAGSRAVGTDHDPVSIAVTPAKPQIVAMERISGQVARNSDARSWRRRDLGDRVAGAVMMPERVFRNSLDEAQVQKLLPRGAGQWVRRIGPIVLTSRRTHFLPVDADVTTGRIQGLPTEWQNGLADRVLQAARSARDSSDDAEAFGHGQIEPTRSISRGFVMAAPRSSASNRRTTVQFTSSDVKIGTSQHDDVLDSAIHRASTSIAIVSPRVDAEVFRQIAARVAKAVQRGVHVDLLYGMIAPDIDPRVLVAVVNEIGYRADNKYGRARLRVREDPTGSGSSLLLYDDPARGLVTLVGNHAWLSPNMAEENSTGLVVTHPSIGADFARAVSSLWRGREVDDSRWAGPGERWKALATAAEDRAAANEAISTVKPGGSNSEAELLVDEEIAIPEQTGEESARVGASVEDSTGGDGGVRGLVLRVVGDGARLIARASAP